MGRQDHFGNHGIGALTGEIYRWGVTDRFGVRKNRISRYWKGVRPVKREFWRGVGYGLLLGGLLLNLVGCSTKNPANLKKYYAERYPASEKVTADPKHSQNIEADKTKANPSLVSPSYWQTSVNNQSEANSPSFMDSKTIDPNPQDEPSKRTGSLSVVKGHLPVSLDVKYANERAETSEYDVSSLIEGKLLKLVEDAYYRRDEVEFTRLYHFFLESFPNSTRKMYLEEKWRTFFYSEDLDVTRLNDALVEVAYPPATSLKELSLYFARLKSNGIGAVQISVVQLLAKPVYLFADLKNHQGYYFKVENRPLADDLLEKILAMAHENSLQVYVALPFRHHPRLGHYPELLVDESWNVIQNRTVPNGKLDLLHPKSFNFLMNILEALTAYPIDGIIFRDDFTYEKTEGFSKTAQLCYEEETGRVMALNQLFVPVSTATQEPYQIVTDGEFGQIALWRTREIKQLVWDVIAATRHLNSRIRIGLEVTPEMLLDDSVSVPWYSTGLRYVKDLDVDFFLLKWRKHQSQAESDEESYQRAVSRLRKAAPENVGIYMKVPLSDRTRNVINLNQRIRKNADLQQEINGAKIAIGPVNRLDQWHLLY